MIFVGLGLFILFAVVSFFLTAGLVWLGCIALGLLGVAVVFTWKIVLAIWIILLILKAIF